MSYEFISNSYDADMTTTQNSNANNSQNKPQLSSQNSSNKQQNNENLFGIHDNNSLMRAWILSTKIDQNSAAHKPWAALFGHVGMFGPHQAHQFF